jgi:hypothetical protein
MAEDEFTHYMGLDSICKISTPIWHPNFRDGQICIGDIWGAGESLSDIIINIGDMIQYKSWNSYSPLSSEAAQWAMENKYLFPVGDLDLNITDYASSKDEVSIDLFDESGNIIEADQQPETVTGAEPEIMSEPAPNGAGETEPGFACESNQEAVTETGSDGAATHEGAEAVTAVTVIKKPTENDFEITAEELAGIEFIPTAQRMQSMAPGGFVKGKRINFKTVLVKGLLWALIGAALGFGISELTDKNITSGAAAAVLAGHSELTDYYGYEDEANELSAEIDKRYKAYCNQNGLDPDDNANFSTWMYAMSSDDQALVDEYIEVANEAQGALQNAYLGFNGTEDEFNNVLEGVANTATGLWAAIIALFVGLFMGIGEGVYYGSKQQAIKYALIGAGISLVMGFISGYFAQWMYGDMISIEATDLAAAFVRGLGWAVMGLGIGLAIGLIKPGKKRILFCALGGLVGAFIGGFLFNYVCDIIPNDIAGLCCRS